MAITKSNILLVGGGGVGTIGAFNLERGGLADVTVVLRSNFDKVKSDGFDIISSDHGVVKGWRPSRSKPLYAKHSKQPVRSDFFSSRKSYSQFRRGEIRSHRLYDKEHSRRSTDCGRHTLSCSHSRSYRHCPRSEWLEHPKAILRGFS